MTIVVASLSLCKVQESSRVVIVRNILASSANRRMSDCTVSGRSFMYITNSTGPKTLPWGIPLSTCAEYDAVFRQYSYVFEYDAVNRSKSIFSMSDFICSISSCSFLLFSILDLMNSFSWVCIDILIFSDL